MSQHFKDVLKAHIKSLMKIEGVNYVELGEKLGVKGSDSNKSQTIGRMLKSAKPDDIEKIADAMGKPVEGFYYDTSITLMENSTQTKTLNKGEPNEGSDEELLKQVLQIKDDEERKLALSVLAKGKK